MAALSRVYSYADLRALQERLRKNLNAEMRTRSVPHRSDTHLKRNGKWVTKTVLCEKRLEA